MSTHKALARQWRPQSFDRFIGQTHAVTALKQSLSRKQVHHAHLFTGTRGVGKTSLARVFAKGLSCEKGITDSPCGQCAHCTAIEDGNYIDLIEIDAASRTKVEDTKELLSQINYPPVQGRFKIYLIDEVHSLSANSFNALLKTLEEPPEHVKFILATTDPQKLPITILSRCIQLHLQHHHIDHIIEHLSNIARNTNIEFETEAIQQIAAAASGSLRDALSLFEQAIAASESIINNKTVSAMFGRADEKDISMTLSAIINNDKEITAQALEKFNNSSANYSVVIDQMLQQLYQITQAQVLHIHHKHSDKDLEIENLAKKISAEQVQLYIQMLIRAKDELDLYPSHIVGFNLLIMRMMTFTLDQQNLIELITSANIDTYVGEVALTQHKQKSTSRASSTDYQAKALLEKSSSSKPNNSPEPMDTKPTPEKPLTQTTKNTSPKHPDQLSDTSPLSDWKKVITDQRCTGLIKQILHQSKCVPSPDNSKWNIIIDPKLSKLATPSLKDKIKDLCNTILEKKISIELSSAVSKPDTTQQSIDNKSPKNITTTPAPTPKKQEIQNATHNKKLQTFAQDLNAELIHSE